MCPQCIQIYKLTFTQTYSYTLTLLTYTLIYSICSYTHAHMNIPPTHMLRLSGPALLLLLLSRFSRVQLCVTPKAAAHQAPPSLGISRQEYWSGVPSPSPRPCPRNVYSETLGHMYTLSTYVHVTHTYYSGYLRLHSKTTLNLVARSNNHFSRLSRDSLFCSTMTKTLAGKNPMTGSIFAHISDTWNHLNG